MYYSSVFVCFANLAFVSVLANVTEKGSVVFPTHPRRPIRFNENAPVWRVTTLQPFPHSPPTSGPPLSMIRKINLVKDEEEFIQLFVAQSSIAQTISSRFGSQVDDKKYPTPRVAKCQPESRTVNLMGDTRDPTLVYFPCCTRVDRCGGCCTHPSLSCQPTELEYKNFTISMYRYAGNQKFERVQEKVVTLESHKKCKCNCAIKAQDCSSSQTYNEEECRCMCLNKDEERKCSYSSHLKLWNPSRCSCDCREGDVGQCGTGQIFNYNSCGCIQSQSSYGSNRDVNYNSYNNYT